MKVNHAIEIEATPETVWSWLGTPEKAVEWQTNVSKTEILHKTPDWTGTTFRETVAEGERGTELQGVVTDYRENRSLAMHLSGQFNTVDIAWQLAPAGPRTLLTVRANVRFRGMIGVMSLLLRPVFRRKMAAQLQEETMRLKTLCEGRR